MIKINKIQETYSLWFRNCCVCGISQPPIRWLCSYCWRQLRSYYLPAKDIIRTQEQFAHIRLFDWNSENDFFIRLFLNSLKKGAPDFIFDEIGRELLHRIIQIQPLEKNTVLIPAPASPKNSIKDHAFCFTASLARISNIPIKNSLLRLFFYEEIQQKQKTRLARQNLHFQIMEEAEKPVTKDINPSQHCIFVDDILTTGATATAAWKALGKPRHFKILTLAWRHFFESSRFSGIKH